MLAGGVRHLDDDEEVALRVRCCSGVDHHHALAQLLDGRRPKDGPPLL